MIIDHDYSTRQSHESARGEHKPDGKRGVGAVLRRTAPAHPPRHKKTRGQAMVVLALSMVVLLAMVGLAIDVGSQYTQRRIAQNSADAVALAGAQVMLEYYEYYLDGGDGEAEVDTAIDSAMTTYADLHHIQRSALQAYYVDDNKQVVTTTQVGTLGSVPWESMGVKGIKVSNYSQTSSFFMSIIGWNTVGAGATAMAFMGVSADSGNGLPVFPVGFFSAQHNLNNMIIDRSYTFLDGKTQDGDTDEWAYPDFNGHGDITIADGVGSVGQAWAECGFNPRILTDANWDEWASLHCEGQVGASNATGPVVHYLCADTDCDWPDSSSVSVPYLKWGTGNHGWWLGGQIGSISDSCSTLSSLIQQSNEQFLYFPIFDDYTESGTDAKLHLRAVAKVWLHDSYVDCDLPAEPCPCPPGVQQVHSEWHVEGDFKGEYLWGGTGSHATLNSWSEHTVFLDN